MLAQLYVYTIASQPAQKSEKNPNILYPRKLHGGGSAERCAKRATGAAIFKYEKWHNDTQDDGTDADGSPAQYKYRAKQFS